VRLALALVFALALPGMAFAQDGSSTPIVGSGSFNAAPLLEPGRYRDTVLPEEYLYYAVDVKAGQALHVTASSELDTGAWSDLNVAFVKVNVAAPDRFELSSAIDGEQSFTSAGDDPADFTTQPATTVAEEDGTEVGWTGPGVYFISFYPAYVGSGDPPKAEIPFHFEIALEGDAQTEPSATPVTTATPAKPKATATPAPADEGGGTSPALAAGFGVAGLAAGAAVGFALRRRPRDSAPG
jgi:Ca-activated chloride channel homolog